MKVLIWPGHHDWMDGLIKFFSHGRGSHVAFLRCDGVTVHEAFYPRVRDRRLSEEDKRLAEVYEVEGITQAQELALEHLWNHNLTLGIEYSFLDCARFALNMPSKDERHTMCSRYAMHCLHAVLPYPRMPLLRVPYGDWVSPRDLRMSPRLKLISGYFKHEHNAQNGTVHGGGLLSRKSD